MTSNADSDRIEELEAELTRVRLDLLTTRDALIGAQAESATLKVRNREIEVRIAQVESKLATHTRLTRVGERLVNHRLTRGLWRRWKQLRGTSDLSE